MTDRVDRAELYREWRPGRADSIVTVEGGGERGGSMGGGGWGLR